MAMWCDVQVCPWLCVSGVLLCAEWLVTGCDVTGNAIGDVGHTTLQRTQLHHTAAGLSWHDVHMNPFDTDVPVSLDSHPGVSAAEHFVRGTFAEPGECVTVYRGSFDLHKATADGKTVSTCGNGLSPYPPSPNTHTHTHTRTATAPHSCTISACGHAQCCDG